MSNLSRRLLGWLAAFVLLGNAVTLPAEPFGDIEVSAQTFFNGNTHRGYTEYRLLVANRSSSRTHQVTLTIPSRTFGNHGPHIGRLSRTVTVGPSATALVSLWQPPLPIAGDTSVSVAVDGRVRGRLNNGFQPHFSRHHAHGSSGRTSTVLLSRNINRDNLDRLLKATAPPASAAKHSPDKATGEPDAPMHISHNPPNTWAANETHGGNQWLELDFAPPLAADGLQIFLPYLHPSSITEIMLKNAKGSDIRTVPPPTHGMVSIPTKGPSKAPPKPAMNRMSAKTSFPITAEPVKTVRITFNVSYGLNWVDAVELSGGTNRAWASAARASSSYANGTGGPHARMTNPHELLRAELDPAQWSEHWITYSAFDVVLLPQADFMRMPEAVRTALWRYTESGGRLAVLGRIEVPETWRNREVSSSNGIAHHRVGLGECLQLDASAVESLTAPQAAKLKMLLAQAAALSLPDENLHNNPDSLNSLFPVVEGTDLPVRGMAFLMLVFILVVGPINLLVLRAFKRRIWFLWTIPVISAATCLLVIIYSLTSEGITPSTRTEAVTLLDQSARRATTAALMAFYCPLTPSDGLHFDTETEVTPLLANDSHRNGESHEVDWSNGQHFRSGWLSARVPAHFFARKSEPRRERLQVERDTNGKLAVVNGLGAPVKTLWLVDAQGQLHKTDAIEAGARATLTATGENTGRGPLPDLSRFVNDPLSQIPSRSLANLKPWLRPGVYFAELEGAPFVEIALTGRTKPRANSLVIGLLEPEALR